MSNSSRERYNKLISSGNYNTVTSRDRYNALQTIQKADSVLQSTAEYLNRDITLNPDANEDGTVDIRDLVRVKKNAGSVSSDAQGVISQLDDIIKAYDVLERFSANSGGQSVYGENISYLKQLRDAVGTGDAAVRNQKVESMRQTLASPQYSYYRGTNDVIKAVQEGKWIDGSELDSAIKSAQSAQKDTALSAEEKAEYKNIEEYLTSVKQVQQLQKDIDNARERYDNAQKGANSFQTALNKLLGVGADYREQAKKDYEEATSTYYALTLGDAEARQKKIDELNEKANSLRYNLDSAHTGVRLPKAEREAAQKELDAINQEIEDIRSSMYGKGELTKYVGKNVYAGMSNFATDVCETLDFLLGTPLKGLGWENNPFSAFSNLMTEENERIASDAYTESLAVGDNYNIGGTIMQGIISTLPDVALTFLSGGSSKAPQMGKGAYSFFSSLSKSLSSLAKNPMYWTSFLRTLGSDYTMAVDNGATQAQAVFFATVTSALNAAVEIGGNSELGGIQNLPKALNEVGTSRNSLWLWFKSALEEGGEEIAQGLISDINAKAIFDPDRQIDIKQTAIEGAYGTAIGGILGGGQISINNILNAKTKSEYESIGSQALSDEDFDFQGIIDYAKNSVDTEIRALALKSTPQNISNENAGQLYTYACRDINSAIFSPADFKTVNANYAEIMQDNPSVAIRSIASSQYVLRVSQQPEIAEFQKIQSSEITGSTYSANMGLQSSANGDIISAENNTDIAGDDTDGLKGNNQATSDGTASFLPESQSAFEEPSAEFPPYDLIKNTGAELAGVTRHSEDQYKIIEIGRKLGYSVKFDNKLTTPNGKAVNGIIDTNKKIIYINPTSKEPIRFIIKHELTHYLEKNFSEYADFANAVMDSEIFKKWITAKGYASISEYNSDIVSTYVDAGIKNFGEAEANYEIIANFVGDKFFSANGQDLQLIVDGLDAKQRPKFIQAILDFISYLKEKIKGTEQTVLDLQKLEKRFIQLLKEMQAKENTAEDSGEMKYSIVNLDSGKSYVQAFRRVIHGNSVAEWRSQISNFFNRALKNGPIKIKTIEGDVLTISKETANKARSKAVTEKGIVRELTDKEFLIKLNAEAHIDELAEISKKNNRPNVPDNKNHSFAKDGFTYRTVYFQDFDDSYYRITLSVGESNGISTVYNVGKIKADDIPDGNIISTIGSKADMSSAKYSIPNSPKKVKHIASPELQSVIDRLSSNETVDIEEIENVPQIKSLTAIVEDKAETYLINTPARSKLRAKVTKELLKLGSAIVDNKDKVRYNGNVKQERRADIVIGLSAAGKSSVLVNPLSEFYSSRIIDSDMAKELLPEFDDGMGANAVHRESQDIIDNVLEGAISNGDNLVWPIVGGGSVDNILSKIERLKAQGYSVYLHLNELPNNKAIARSLNRYLEDGRFIPPGIIREYGDTPTKNFYTILNMEGKENGRRVSGRISGADEGSGVSKAELVGANEKSHIPREERSGVQKLDGRVISTFSNTEENYNGRRISERVSGVDKRSGVSKITDRGTDKTSYLASESRSSREKSNDRVIAGGLIDGYSHYSNDVPRLENPKLIAISENLREFAERDKVNTEKQSKASSSEAAFSFAESDANNSEKSYGYDTGNLKIVQGMSDEQRYEILKNRKITVAQVNEEKYRKVLANKSELLDKSLKTTAAKRLLRRIGEEFGVFKEYQNQDIEVEFEFGKNNLDESLNKQKGNYDTYAQMLSCFSDVISNAVGIEVHNRNSQGYKVDRTLKNVYVLCSAFENSDGIIPVKLEIKEFYDKANRLYVAVALEAIKKDRVVSMGVPNTRSHIRTSPVNISISDIFENVNLKDIDFIKYIPNEFLNDEKRYSINTVSAETLLERYENGEITREEYLSRLRGEEIKTPVEIASMKKEDANTTPPLKRREGKNYGDKESNFYGSLLGSSIFDDAFKAEVENDTFIKNYQSITNKQTLKEAAAELDAGGQAYVDRWRDRKPERANLIDIAVGLILIDRYQRVGDYDSAVAVAEKVREFGTASGRQVQIFSILGRLDPNSMTAYAQKELNKAFELMAETRTQKWIDANRSKFELTDEDVEFIRRRTLQAAMLEDGNRQKAILLAEICTRFQDKIPPESGQAIRALQRTSMLLNVKTNLRNITGNAGMVPVFIASDFFGSGIDRLVAKKTGVRTTGNFQAKGSGAALKKGLYESWDDFRRGIRTKQEELDRFDVNKGGGKNFNEHHDGKFAKQLNAVAKKLNEIDNFTSFCLEAGDRPFFEMWMNNSLNNQLRLNNVTVPTPDMLDIARTEALQRTWQDNNKFTRSVSKIKDVFNGAHLPGTSYGLGDFIYKFVKTPANLAKAIVEFSPAGFAFAGAKFHDMEIAMGKGKFTPQMQKEFVRSLSNAITGTIIYALVAVGAGMGVLKLSGGGDDDKDVSNFEKYIVGIPPYSINLFGVNVTYDWMQPVGSVLAIVADFMENRHDDPEGGVGSDILSALKAGGDVFTKQSFLQSLYDVFSSEGIGEAFISLLLSEPAAFIPQRWSQMASLLDKSRRTTYDSQSEFKTAINKIIAKIPGLRQMLPEQVNVLGETAGNTQYLNPWEAFAAPGNTYPKSSGEVAESIYELYKQTGNKSVMPRVAPNDFSVKGNKIIFSPEEKADFQRRIGSLSSELLSEFFSNSKYEELSDEEKIDVVSDIYSYATARAKAELDYDYEILSAMVGKKKDKSPILTREKYDELNDKARKYLAEDYFLSEKEMKYIDDAEKLVEYYIERAED